MNSLLDSSGTADNVVVSQKEQQKEAEDNYFMDEEAEEEPEDRRLHSPPLITNKISGSGDSRKEERKDEEGKGQRGSKRKHDAIEDGSQLLPSIQTSIVYSPPSDSEVTSPRPAATSHAGVNTLPEKIANHPWILCLTKNDYVSSSQSDTHAQQQQQQQPQQRQQQPQQPQQSLLFPPASGGVPSPFFGHQGSPQYFQTYLGSPPDLQQRATPPTRSDAHLMSPHHSSHPQQQQQQPHQPQPQSPARQLQQLHQQTAQQQPPHQPQHGGYQIVSTTTRPSSGVIHPPQSGPSTAAPEDGQLSKESNFLDITEYLNMPQTQAAKHIGIPTSTLSKRWREAARQRKWPWRTVCKIDKEIMTLLHNVPTSSLSDENSIPEDVKQGISLLLRKRQAELQSVVIRIN